MNDKNPTNPFNEHIARISSDPRFRDIASEDSKRICALTLWVIEFDWQASRETRLLYGWIVPSPESTPTSWFFTKPQWNSAGDSTSSTRFRLGRLNLNNSVASINAVIRELGLGLDLSASCAKAGLLPPPEYANLRFGFDAAAIARTFQAGLPRFLTTSLAQNSLKSPTTGPVFCASVFRLHKTDLFATGPQIVSDIHPTPPEPAEGADDIARKALGFLSDESGLAFSSTDARRLGDLEWIQPATEDQFGNDSVDISCERSAGPTGEIISKAVIVTIKPGKLAVGLPLLIRCRTFMENEIAGDECRKVAVGDSPIRFSCHEHLSRYVVTLWRFDDSATGEILFEEDAWLVRSIVISTGIIGLQGRFETDWTASIKTKNKLIERRVEKVRALSQVSYQTFGIGSLSAQEKSEQEISSLAKSLFPPSSTAKFFPRGWHAEQGPGKLAFVEWFQGLTEDPTTTAIVIVDPYFDDVGITDMISRAKGTNIEYVVLTSAQTPSDDDASKGLGRRARIPAICEKLRGLLSHIRFSILDLQSQGTRTEALFHDRYVLIYGPQAQITKGYSLSNSIQGATVNAPLLVTPIPEDVLPEIAAYVAALRTADSAYVQNARVETLFTTEIWRTGPTKPPKSAVIPGLSVLFALLLNDSAIREYNDAELRSFLVTQGLADAESFIFSPNLRIDVLFDKLAEASEPEFITLWHSFSEWNARVIDPRNSIGAALKRKGDLIAARLAEFLATAPSRPAPTGTANLPADTSITGLRPLFLQSFEEIHSRTPYLEDIFCRFEMRGAFPLRYAIERLADIAPELLVRVTDNFVEKIQAKNMTDDSSPGVLPIMRVLVQIPAPLLDTLAANPKHIAPILSASRVGLLSALIAQHYINRKDIDAALNELTLLDDDKQLLLLTELCGDLRIKANRNNFTETAAIRANRLKLFNSMLAIWPDSMTDTNFSSIVQRLGGPGGLTGADSITQDLLIPLVNKKRLSNDQIVSVWGGLIEKELDSMLSQSENASYFNKSQDVALSEAFARVLAVASDDSRSRYLASFSSKLQIAKRKLLKPFARASNNRGWTRARDCADWVWALMALTELNAKDLAATPIEQWIKARNDIGSALAILPASGNTDLSDFVHDVNDRLLRNGKPI